jgi:hypothetical protein
MLNKGAAMNNAFLDTIVQLVAMGALGAAVACIIVSAALLFYAFKIRENNKNIICLIIGLVFQLTGSFIHPKINVSYVFEPSKVPAGLDKYQPHWTWTVNGSMKGDAAIESGTREEYDRDVVVVSYVDLIDHLKDVQKAEALAEAQTNEAGP